MDVDEVGRIGEKAAKRYFRSTFRKDGRETSLRHGFCGRYQVYDWRLPALVGRNLAVIDRVQHGRPWREVKRNVVRQRPLGTNGNYARSPSSFDVRVRDFGGSNIHRVTTVVAEETAVGYYRSQIAHVRYVVNGRHQP